MAKVKGKAKIGKSKSAVAKAVKKIAKKSLPSRRAAAKLVTASKRSAKHTKTAQAKKISAKKADVKKANIKKADVKKTITQKSAIKPEPVAKAKRPFGIPEQLRDAAMKILDERQAEDIVSLDLTGRSSLADYVIVASGRASRQIGAIAHYLREAFEALGVKPVRTEGVSQGDWVLVDGGDVIVHLFKPEVRAYYNIETMWNARPDKSAKV